MRSHRGETTWINRATRDQGRARPCAAMRWSGEMAREGGVMIERHYHIKLSFKDVNIIFRIIRTL